MEAEVREGVMVTMPPPPPHTRMEREYRKEVRTVGTEVGCHRENGLIGGMGK